GPQAAVPVGDKCQFQTVSFQGVQRGANVVEHTPSVRLGETPVKCPKESLARGWIDLVAEGGIHELSPLCARMAEGFSSAPGRGKSTVQSVHGLTRPTVTRSHFCVDRPHRRPTLD